jgi:hypothetical protein
VLLPTHLALVPLSPALLVGVPFVLSGEALPDHQGLVGVRPLVIDDEHPHPVPAIPLPAGVSAGAGAIGVLPLFASPLGVLEPGGLEEDGQELAFREHLGEVAQARPPPTSARPAAGDTRSSRPSSRCPACPAWTHRRRSDRGTHW